MNEDLLVKKLVRPSPLSKAEIIKWLESLQSVDFISHIKQASILYLDNGFYVAGVTVESPAFTGFNSIQAAVSIATTCFGSYKIKELWFLSSSKKNHILPADSMQPLSLSALQTLHEFAYSEHIPVHLLSSSGDMLSIKLYEASKMISSSKKMYLDQS